MKHGIINLEIVCISSIIRIEFFSERSFNLSDALFEYSVINSLCVVVMINSLLKDSYSNSHPSL
jgi:hypothetical protein